MAVSAIPAYEAHARSEESVRPLRKQPRSGRGATRRLAEHGERG